MSLFRICSLGGGERGGTLLRTLARRSARQPEAHGQGLTLSATIFQPGKWDVYVQIKIEVFGEDYVVQSIGRNGLGPRAESTQSVRPGCRVSTSDFDIILLRRCRNIDVFEAEVNT
jgi:hypothetical protein